MLTRRLANARPHSRSIATLELAKSRRARGGFTLIELLVVVLILLLVTAAAIPIMVPAMQGRHVREASRQVNSYFAVARDTALRTGRPVGVMIERFSTTDDTGAISRSDEFSVVLSQVEVPPPYSGDFATSRATIDVSDPNQPKVSLGGTDVGWLGLIRAGDLIQFNYQGNYYVLNGEDNDPMPTGEWIPQGEPLENGPWTLSTPWTRSSAEIQATVPWSSAPGPLPYRVVRQPVRTAIPPLQLTGTVIIDLNWSSDDFGYFIARDLSSATDIPKLKACYLPDKMNQVDDVRPVIVMFAPDGSLHSIYRSLYNDTSGTPIWDWKGRRPSGPVHLLIGQRDKVPSNPNRAEQSLNNWRDVDNLWVSINHQTGLVTTTENVDVDPSLESDPFGNVIPPGGIYAARNYATRSQSMGGR